jgi:hypothetical protein
MEWGNWRTYLPSYRFPNFLKGCFGCLGFSLVGASVLIFFILPSIFSYINSLDVEPIFDVEVGAFLDLGEYRLDLLNVENDTRCPGETNCTPPGSAIVRFRNTFDLAEQTIEFSEGGDFSDVVSIPQGYAIRVIDVSPDSYSPSNNYTVRFQIFQPPGK